MVGAGCAYLSVVVDGCVYLSVVGAGCGGRGCDEGDMCSVEVGSV